MRKFAGTSQAQVNLSSTVDSGLHGVIDLQSLEQTISPGAESKTSWDGLQVYEDAGRAYVALEDHLRSNSGKGSYFFGSRPSSLDAAIFAHLAFHHGAPVSAPELRQKVSWTPHHMNRLGAKICSLHINVTGWPCIMHNPLQNLTIQARLAAGGAPDACGICGSHQPGGVLNAAAHSAAHHIDCLGTAR